MFLATFLPTLQRLTRLPSPSLSTNADKAARNLSTSTRVPSPELYPTVRCRSYSASVMEAAASADFYELLRDHGKRLGCLIIKRTMMSLRDN